MMLDALYLLATLETAQPQLPLPREDIILAAASGRGGFKRVRGGPTGIDPEPPICPGDPECPPVGDEESPEAEAGASLPISGFTVASLPGNHKFISPSGNDANLCTELSPCLTISRAQAVTTTGDTIVVRGGTYRGEGSSCTWSSGVCTYTSQTSIGDANLTIIAYPNETPIFNGAEDVTADFGAAPIVSGQKCISYSPIPVTDGAGTNFASSSGLGQNITGGVEGVGKFSDGVWVNDIEFQQVNMKALVTAGKFWVSSTFPLGGTVSVTNGSPTLTGSGTRFLSAFVAGDSLTVGAVTNSLAAPVGTIQTRTILSVNSDTSITVTSNFTTTVAGTKVRKNGTHVLCLVTADADGNGGIIDVSNKGNWLSINSTDVTIRGIRVQRYSNTQARFGVFIVNNSADRLTVDNSEINDSALTTVSLSGATTSALADVTFTDVTINDSNWVGIIAYYTDDFLLRRYRAQRGDPWDEFTASPSSGAIKTAKNRGTIIDYSLIADNRGHGLWMDESNFNTVICSNIIRNNASAAGDNSLFYEISALALVCNNYLQAPTKSPARIAGSSEMRLWNNTFITTAGTDALQFVADGRSIDTPVVCADPAIGNPPPAICDATSWIPSNWWEASWASRPNNLDWMPRLSEMFNNMVVGSTGIGLCSPSVTAFCIASQNVGSTSSIEEILHPAIIGRTYPIPATTMDTNLYANGLGNIITRKHTSSVNYTAAQIGTWKSYLAGAPVSRTLDANSIADPTGSTYVDPATGVPTGTLNHNLATAVPVDAVLNQYIPAGTKHFGVLWN